MLHTQKIVFVGGPSTGKTRVINKLRNKGCFCFEEVSRQITIKAQKEGISQLFLDNPLLFSQKLLQGRIDQYKKARQINEELCFFDRGIPEVSAYMNYKKETVPKTFLNAEQKHRYDKVFLFPLWKEIYKSDNERYESFEEARAIHPYIESTYKNLGYSLIEVPKTSVDARVKFILSHIKHAYTK